MSTVNSEGPLSCFTSNAARRLAGFSLVILVVAGVQTLTMLMVTVALLPGRLDEPFDFGAGFAGNAVAGLFAAGFSWWAIRLQGYETPRRLWLGAAVGPTVMVIFGLPLLLLFQWVAAVLLAEGLVLGTLGFGLVASSTRQKA